MAGYVALRTLTRCNSMGFFIWHVNSSTTSVQAIPVCPNKEVFQRKKRRKDMDVIDERALVYVAVLFVCSALAVFVGFGPAALTFSLVAVSIESAYLMGRVWRTQ